MRVGTHQHDVSVVCEQHDHAVVTQPVGHDYGMLDAPRPAGRHQRPLVAEFGVQGGVRAVFGPDTLAVRHPIAGQRTVA
jgi:hypothetical protein